MLTSAPLADSWSSGRESTLVRHLSPPWKQARTRPIMTNSGEPTLPPETSQTAASSPAWPTPRVFLPPTASTSAQPAVASSSTSSTPSSSASRIVPPVSNEDPKPTAEEIKAAYASTLERNQRAGIGPDAPLMTKAMREKHEAKFDKGKTKKTYQEVRCRSVTR